MGHLSATLFQRVRATSPDNPLRWSPFTFGCGVSGLTGAGEDHVAKVLAVDYMPQDEYKYGGFGRCLQALAEAEHLELTASGGYGFLTIPSLTDAAHAAWADLVAGRTEPLDPLLLDDAGVIGWFDIENYWFVARKIATCLRVEDMLLGMPEFESEAVAA